VGLEGPAKNDPPRQLLIPRLCIPPELLVAVRRPSVAVGRKAIIVVLTSLSSRVATEARSRSHPWWPVNDITALARNHPQLGRKTGMPRPNRATDRPHPDIRSRRRRNLRPRPIAQCARSSARQRPGSGQRNQWWLPPLRASPGLIDGRFNRVGCALTQAITSLPWCGRQLLAIAPGGHPADRFARVRPPSRRRCGPLDGRTSSGTWHRHWEGRKATSHVAVIAPGR